MLETLRASTKGDPLKRFKEKLPWLLGTDRKQRTIKWRDAVIVRRERADQVAYSTIHPYRNDKQVYYLATVRRGIASLAIKFSLRNPSTRRRSNRDRLAAVNEAVVSCGVVTYCSGRLKDGSSTNSKDP